MIRFVEAQCDLNGWHDYLKQPDGAMECVLKVTHAPGWLVAVLVVGSCLLAWWEFARKRHREVRQAAFTIRSRTSAANRAYARLVAWGLLLLVASFAVARLSDMLFIPHGRASTMWQGMSSENHPQYYSVAYQWALLSAHPYVTYVVAWSLAGAALMIVLLVWGALAHADTLRGTATFLLGAACMVGLVLGGLCVVAALGNGFGERPPASTTLPFFFGSWAGALLLLSLSAARLSDAGSSLAYTVRLGNRTGSVP